MNKQFNEEGLYRVPFKSEDGCNVTDEVILEQVAINIRRQLPQVMPHEPNKETVALVCGGPSLAKTEKELVQAYWDGAKVIALNGAYQWCVDHNIKPSGMIMLDARQFNSRFVQTPVAGCKYILAAQCHPEVFEICKDREVYLCHPCSAGEVEYQMLKEYYFGRLFPIPLGTTVAIKGIQILSMLGFKSFILFGADSCWIGDQHHAYPQTENDSDKYLPTWISPEGRPDLAEKFYCAPWHMRQQQDFMTLIRKHGNDFRIDVRGDGLLAATMRIAAQMGSEVKVDMNEPS